MLMHLRSLSALLIKLSAAVRARGEVTETDVTQWILSIESFLLLLKLFLDYQLVPFWPPPACCNY